MARYVPLAFLLALACGRGPEPASSASDASWPFTTTDTDTDADSDADSDADADADTDTDRSTDTAGPTDTGPLPTGSASCAVSSHPLRVDCQATLATAGQAELVLTDPTGAERRFASDGALATHDLTAWGLRADTAYTWSLAGASGTVVTGSLPTALRNATVWASGTTDAFDAVLQPLICDGTTYMTLIDREGEIVGYEATDHYSSGMHAYDIDVEARSLMVADASTFTEVGFDGRPGLTLSRGVDFDGDLHHDVERWNGYTYLLFQYTTSGALVDGIHVFDGSTLVGTFRLGDHYEVESGAGGPNPIGNDWSHGNGIQATDDGRIVLSLLKFSTVVVIDGDPASPTFLDILETVAGVTAGSLPSPDVVPAAGAGEGFAAQHNASLVGDDLYVFDNTGTDNRSRAARYTLSGGTLTLDAAWPFDDRCLIQGGAIAIGDGVLGTCATVQDVRWFAEGDPVARWRLEATCSTTGPVAFNRAIPIVFD